MPTSGYEKKGWTFSPVHFLGLSSLALLCSFAVAAQTPQPATGEATSATSQEGVPQTPGSITGRVIDQAGVYIGGAQVTLTIAGRPA